MQTAELKKISARIANGKSAGILDISQNENDIFVHVPGEELKVAPVLKNFEAEILKKENEWKSFEQRAAALEIKYGEYESKRNWQLAETTEALRKQREAEAKFTKSQFENLKANEPAELEKFISDANNFLNEVNEFIIQPLKEKVKSAETRLKKVK